MEYKTFNVYRPKSVVEYTMEFSKEEVLELILDYLINSGIQPPKGETRIRLINGQQDDSEDRVRLWIRCEE